VTQPLQRFAPRNGHVSKLKVRVPNQFQVGIFASQTDLSSIGAQEPASLVAVDAGRNVAALLTWSSHQNSTSRVGSVSGFNAWWIESSVVKIWPPLPTKNGMRLRSRWLTSRPRAV